MAKKSEAIAVKNFKGQWKDADAFTSWLAQELDSAIGNRGQAMDEIRLAWAYYEQARMRSGNSPWPDAADLPSPYAPEYTDAVHARLIKILFDADPVWTVEGWGGSAVKAPYVEEFHQRAQEDERLKDYADEWLLRGLVEGVGTLEVSEAFEMRTERVRKRVALELDQLTNTPILDEKNQPKLAVDPETGEHVEVQDEQTPSAEIETDVLEPVRLGPDYDVVPYADFFVLPAHARTKKQIWGYAKRFWRRVPELQARAKDGIYDADAVEGLGTDNERAANADETPRGPVPVSQDGMTAQKELFEVQILAELDGQGERWWRVTLSKERTKLLRIVPDDRTTRYIRWAPFLRPGTVDRGYSLISNKLISILEKDTADRNMAADNKAMVLGQPVMKQQGALWDEFEQPWGPRAVITVRNMNEIKAFEGIRDYSASMLQDRQANRTDADRLIGQNDVALGVQGDDAQKPTATQVSTTAAFAEVRIDVIVGRAREPLEELWQVRHEIWKRTLQNRQNMPPSRAMVIGKTATGIDTQGLATDQLITPEMLEGIYWAKPKGSVETADIGRQRQDLIGLLGVLPQAAQLNPALGMIFQTMPAAKALAEQIVRVFRWPDRQSILGAEGQNVFDTMQQQQEIQSDPRMQLLMAMTGGGGSPQMGGGMPPEQGAAPPMPPQGMVQ